MQNLLPSSMAVSTLAALFSLMPGMEQMLSRGSSESLTIEPPDSFRSLCARSMALSLPLPVLRQMASSSAFERTFVPLEMAFSRGLSV